MGKQSEDNSSRVYIVDFGLAKSCLEAQVMSGFYWENGKENGNYRDCRGYIGIIGYILGFIGRMEKKMETTIVCQGYIGIKAKKMETAIVYWGYMGIMEKKMETTIVY